MATVTAWKFSTPDGADAALDKLEKLQVERLAVLLGVLAICSGIFHLVRIFGRGEAHRVWNGIAGLIFIVVGVALIRHLDLTLALVGLYGGITWIVQGVTALTVLALLLGIWFIVMGIAEVIGGLMLRHVTRAASESLALITVPVPEERLPSALGESPEPGRQRLRAWRGSPEGQPGLGSGHGRRSLLAPPRR